MTATKRLKGVEFELAYLALLTKRGLKPLSRWERPWNRTAEDVLHELGLHTRVIQRHTRDGRAVPELVFSPDTKCLDVYARHFDRRPLGDGPGEVRLAGRLLGYPSCCVESFARRGYAPNALPSEDQRILFHWACPRCALTPLLVPLYRRTHEDCRRWLETGKLPAWTNVRQQGKRAKRGLAAAACSLAVWLGWPGASMSNEFPPDPHWLRLDPAEDPDADYLRTIEELSLGMDPQRRDEDGNWREDGLDLAYGYADILKTLPHEPRPDGPYIEDHLTFGVERCLVGPQTANMGFMTVTNPLEGLSIDVPYIAQHFLERGSFSYEGEIHQGRLNVPMLHVVLEGQGDSHWLPVKPDTDGDLLTDSEEQDLRTDPQNPDENHNGVPDGADLAKQLAEKIHALPTGPQLSADAVYRIEFPLRGLERCDICGLTVNMGHFTVVNEQAGLYSKVPCIALHAMEHGSFSFAGDVHGKGRQAVWLLERTLHSTCGTHLRPIRDDADRDGLKDFEEPRFGMDAQQRDTDLDGVPDGFVVARMLGQEVEALPTTPNTTCYAVDHRLRGLVACDVCGELVNMGWREVINPRENLRVNVPYLALHAMRYGSLSYTADDRINPCLLDIALHGDGTSHLVIPKGDSDRDGLTDQEEPYFGLDPSRPDTDGDRVLDGVQLARSLHKRVSELPTEPQQGGAWVVHIPADCYAPCPVCAEMINCGLIEVTNDWSGLKLPIRYLALHYMERGSFSTADGQRVDPIRLDTLLQPGVLIHGQAGQISLRWTGQPGRTYELFIGPDLEGPWTLERRWIGDGSLIEYQDPEPATRPRRFYKVVVRPNEPHLPQASASD